MAIVFEVIDLACQRADQSFFVPSVRMTTKSTSTYATLHGYSEFGTPSLPPKKYRTVNVTGFSKRTAVTAEQTPRQCAGATYVFEGAGQVDMNGKQISNFKKNFWAQCPKKFWPSEPLQLNPLAISSEDGSFPKFVGYCWPADPASCGTCDPDEDNWPFLGDYAVGGSGGLLIDLTAFKMFSHASPVITKTSWSINQVYTAFTALARNGPYTAVTSGVKYIISSTGIDLNAETVFADPPSLMFPVVSINGYIGEYVFWTDTNNYSAVLTDEYTDADAVANATVFEGTGSTAQNLPRTTGFTTVTTNVVYTLLFSNLIVGRNYVATVDLWDKNPSTGASVHTTKSYPFTAAASTYSIVDSIDTPASGHTTTVRLPQVRFA